MLTKKCSKCGEEKETTQFYVRKNSGDGFRCNCKQCDKIYNKNRITNNLLLSINSTLKNKKCSFCKLILDIKEFSKNRSTKDGYAHYCRKCLYKNYSKRYEENKEKFKKRTIEYRKTEIGRLNRNKHESKRRANKRNVPTENYNPIDIFEEFGFKCFNCGENKNLTIDHIIPLIKGGHDTKNNLCLLCLSCNSKKSKKLPSEFYSDEKLSLLQNIKLISHQNS